MLAWIGTLGLGLTSMAQQPESPSDLPVSVTLEEIPAPVPAPVPAPEVTPALELSQPAEQPVTGRPGNSHAGPPADENGPVVFGDWLGYNSTESDTTWLTGTGDDLGVISLETYPALDIGKDAAALLGTGFHFLNGPISTDLPPRLFDFQIAYQQRKPLGDRSLIDYRIGMGAFSDFEGSARKGVRFPGHVVAYHEWHPWFISLFGIESLDRDDISVLPVVGAVWRPADDLILDLVFPRPKAQLRVGDEHSIYLAGELGGGTWAIERVDGTNDNATLRDLRLLLGLLNFEDGDSALEFGWAFDRSLHYRSGLGNMSLDQAFLLRFRSLY